MLKDTIIKEEAISIEIANDSWSKMGSFSKDKCVFI